MVLIWFDLNQVLDVGQISHDSAACSKLCSYLTLVLLSILHEDVLEVGDSPVLGLQGMSSSFVPLLYQGVLWLVCAWTRDLDLTLNHREPL